MSTTIKTIYGSDMRRFTITDEQTSSTGAFASLQKTIGDSYGLVVGAFALSFVDDDGDSCHMGSDAEMVEAVRFAAKTASRTLKLIVTAIVPKEAAPTVTATPVPVPVVPSPATPPTDTNTSSTNGDPLVVPSVGNIAPVFPGKVETRSKLHEHALIFAYGLSSRHCDGCGARPIATAYQCKKCNYDLCADCFDRTRIDPTDQTNTVVTITPLPVDATQPAPVPVLRVPSIPKTTPSPTPVPSKVVSGFGDAAGTRAKSTNHACQLTYAIAVRNRNCDGCRRNPIPNAWQCTTHDYDLCDTCMASSRVILPPSPTPASSYRSKLHPHVLTLAVGLTGHNCDVCQAKPIATAYQCKSCNYDQCARCYIFNQASDEKSAPVVTPTPVVPVTPVTPTMPLRPTFSHPLHEAHPLTFAIDLTSQNLYCDICKARPLAAAWRCGLCHFEICSACFGPVPEEKKAATPTPIVAEPAPVVVPTPVVAVPVPVVPTPVAEPVVVVAPTPTPVVPVVVPVVVVPGVMIAPSSTSVNRSKLHREHDLTWYENLPGASCDGCKRGSASVWRCEACGFDLCGICFTGTKLPPAVLATMMTPSQVTPAIVRVPSTPPVVVPVVPSPVVVTKKPSEAQFVAYVTLQTNSEVMTDATDTATVLIMNSGDDAWPSDARIVHKSGAIVGGWLQHSNGYPLPATGAGEMVELSFPVKYHTTIGRQLGEFGLVHADGTPFVGSGATITIDVYATLPYSVKIVNERMNGAPVREALVNSTIRYNFTIGNMATKPLVGAYAIYRASQSSAPSIVPSELNDAKEFSENKYMLPTIAASYTGTLSILVTMPSVAGTHHGTWILYRPDGKPFEPVAEHELIAEVIVAGGAAPVRVPITKDEWLREANGFLQDSNTRREVGRIMAAIASSAPRSA